MGELLMGLSLIVFVTSSPFRKWKIINWRLTSVIPRPVSLDEIAIQTETNAL